jgi:hypothetical protein
MVPVTAEGSQSAPASPEGSESAPVKAQTTGNQQLRIGILVVVAALIGVGLWLAFGNSNGKHRKTHNVAIGIGPISQSARQLSSRALAVGQPFYWAGPKKNYHYEFQRLAKNGNIYVRYLPKGVPARGKPGELTIIATYPMVNAYGRLKRGAKGRVVTGKRGSIVWVQTNDPKSVYIAWKGVPYEVEVYNPNPRKAARIAEDGSVTTVG